MLCTGCGHWRPDGAVVDVGDGDGPLWTCPDCVRRLSITPFWLRLVVVLTGLFVFAGVPLIFAANTGGWG